MLSFYQAHKLMSSKLILHRILRVELKSSGAAEVCDRDASLWRNPTGGLLASTWDLCPFS